MANSNLTNAKRAKNDEFYTQYGDIQKEIDAYLDCDANVFRGKVVYCNCDDPFESNFFRYFVLNFNKLGLKQLITTSYKPSPVANMELPLYGDDKTLTKSKGRPKINANKFIINEVHDIDGDGEFNLKDVAMQLKVNKNNEWTRLDEAHQYREFGEGGSPLSITLFIAFKHTANFFKRVVGYRVSDQGIGRMAMR